MLLDDSPGWSFISTLPGASRGHHPLYVQIPRQYGWHQLPRIPLGFLRDIFERRECPFCRLVSHSIRLSLQLYDNALQGKVVQDYGLYPLFGSCSVEKAFCYLDNVDKTYTEKPSGAYSLRVWIVSDTGFNKLRAVDLHHIPHRRFLMRVGW